MILSLAKRHILSVNLTVATVATVAEVILTNVVVDCKHMLSSKLSQLLQFPVSLWSFWSKSFSGLLCRFRQIILTND